MYMLGGCIKTPEEDTVTTIDAVQEIIKSPIDRRSYRYVGWRPNESGLI